MAETGPLLQVRNAWKQLGPDWVLRGVTLECGGPGLLVIRGPNGSGKSTLARLILGIHAPDRGSVRVAGVDPARRPREAQLMVASALEGGWLPAHARGIDIAGDYAAARGVPWSRIEEEAERLGVTPYWRRRTYQYSMGMRKRLLLALALAGASRARILLLDEPYTLLDPGTRERLAARLVEASRERLVIVITHITTKAEREATAEILMENGTVANRRGAC